MTKQDKKLTQPEKPLPPIPGTQLLHDPVVSPPETASPKAVVPTASPASSVPANTLATAGVPLPETSDKAAPPPAAPSNWRDLFVLWFWNPGTVIGIIGIVITSVLAWYFYEASKIKPLLTFGVHPLKTELQRPDFDKELGFIYKGKQVDSQSITSVQVSIWNSGTKSIHYSEVLEPIRIVIPDGSAILSVRVKKVSRLICYFECLEDQEDYRAGKCRLKWRILEPGDGAVLQIIYAGGALDEPKLEGAVEGQPEGIVDEEYSLNVNKTRITPSITKTRFWLILIFLVICLTLFVIAIKIGQRTESAKQMAQAKAAAERHLAELRKRRRIQPIEGLLLAAVLVCIFAIVTLFAISALSYPGPPFGW